MSSDKRPVKRPKQEDEPFNSLVNGFHGREPNAPFPKQYVAVEKKVVAEQSPERNVNPAKVEETLEMDSLENPMPEGSGLEITVESPEPIVEEIETPEKLNTELKPEEPAVDIEEESEEITIEGPKLSIDEDENKEPLEIDTPKDLNTELKLEEPKVALKEEEEPEEITIEGPKLSIDEDENKEPLETDTPKDFSTELKLEEPTVELKKEAVERPSPSADGNKIEDPLENDKLKIDTLEVQKPKPEEFRLVVEETTLEKPAPNGGGDKDEEALKTDNSKKPSTELKLEEPKMIEEFEEKVVDKKIEIKNSSAFVGGDTGTMPGLEKQLEEDSANNPENLKTIKEWPPKPRPPGSTR